MINRQNRIFQESNTSAASYLYTLNMIATEANGINDGFNQISDAVQDAELQQDTSTLRYIGTKIYSGLSYIPIVLGWKKTWDTIKNYYHEENKNLEKTLDLAVNIASTAATIAITTAVLAGATYIAPWILAGALGLGAAYGFVNVIKHSYRAFRAHRDKDLEKRSQHLWAIPEQVISTAINAFGFVLNLSFAFNIGSSIKQAVSAMLDAQSMDFANAIKTMKSAIASLKITGTAFKASKSLLYSFGALVTFGTVASFAKATREQNAETLAVLRHPITALKNGVNSIKESCNNAWEFAKRNKLKATALAIPVAISAGIYTVGVAIKAVARTLSLISLPAQVFGNVLGSAFTKLSNVFSRNKIAPTPDVEAEHEAAHAKLKALVDQESTQLVQKILAHKSSNKTLAKLQFVRNIKSKLGENVTDYGIAEHRTLENLAHEAKRTSPKLYQSFFREEGNVEKIARLTRDFEDKHSQRVAAAAYINGL